MRRWRCLPLRWLPGELQQRLPVRDAEAARLKAKGYEVFVAAVPNSPRHADDPHALAAFEQIMRGMASDPADAHFFEAAYFGELPRLVDGVTGGLRHCATASPAPPAPPAAAEGAAAARRARRAEEAPRAPAAAFAAPAGAALLLFGAGCVAIAARRRARAAGTAGGAEPEHALSLDGSASGPLANAAKYAHPAVDV